MQIFSQLETHTDDRFTQKIVNLKNQPDNEMTQRLANLKTRSDDELTETLAAAVQQELKANIFVLHVLAEFERRRLYSKNSCSSLFDYCTKVLKLSGGSAQRRIDAMRAMKIIPSIEHKLATGELNLSTVSQAQSLFRHEAKIGKAYSVEQKIEVLQKLENKSSRECEREIAAISPLAIPQEKRRVLFVDADGNSKTELKVVLDQTLVSKLDRIKDLLSHKKPQMNDRELLEQMADLALAKLDPEQKAKRVCERRAAKARSLPTSEVESRYIPTKVKRQVWIRDGGMCTHPGCGARRFLEYDHIVPHSMGGLSTIENVRLLCRAHNQRAAIEQFGLQKMKRYLEGPPTTSPSP